MLEVRKLWRLGGSEKVVVEKHLFICGSEGTEWAMNYGAFQEGSASDDSKNSAQPSVKDKKLCIHQHRHSLYLLNWMSLYRLYN